MISRYRHWVLGLLLASCFGCRHGSNAGMGWILGTLPPVALDRDTDRPPFAVDVSAVPAAESLGAGQPDGGATFRALNESQSQDLAASRAVLAQLLLQESEAVAAQAGQPGASSEATESLSLLLKTRAVEERNRAAARGLELLQRIAEAEDGFLRLTDSLNELAAMLSDIEQVRRHGLAVPVSTAELEGQQLDLIQQQEELSITVRQLNRQLADLLGLDPLDPCRIWPELDLTVTTQTPEPGEALATARVMRADLAMLYYLRSADAATLPAMQQALGQSSPGLGISLRSIALLHVFNNDAAESETCQRRGQIETLLADREASVARELNEAIGLVQNRLRQIAVRKEQTEALQRRLAEVQQQQSVGAATAWDVRRVRLDAIKADQQLMHDVIQWKIASVQLKAAQGLLAAECGYSLPIAATCKAGNVDPETSKR